jgi:hypothetical protein
MLQRAAQAAWVAGLLAALPATAGGGVTVVAQADTDRGLEAALGEAAARCIPLLDRTLKADLSGDVTLFVYPSKERFAQALMQAGSNHAMAWRLASHPSVHALTSKRSVLFNQATTLPLNPRGRQELLCHELTHVYENELGGGARPPSHQWLRESYAMLMGVLALDELRLDTLAAVRERAVREVKSGKTLPRLAQMVSFEQYRDTIDRVGSRTNTLYLILAAEHLVDLTSHDAVARYFRLARLGASTGLEANFREAFGMTVDDFQARLDGHVAALAARN